MSETITMKEAEKVLKELFCPECGNVITHNYMVRAKDGLHILVKCTNCGFFKHYIIQI